MRAVQLRTVLQYADRTILVLVYVFLHGSEPYSLSAGIKMLFLVYALLHSSEPGSVITAFFFSFGICVLYRSEPWRLKQGTKVPFWYMCFCTAPNHNLF